MSKPSGLRYRILEFGIWNLELPETCSSKLSTGYETGVYNKNFSISKNHAFLESHKIRTSPVS